MSSTRPEVARFFSLVHTTVFKPAGFSKVRHTFSRKDDGYLVAFQFQGSDWNDSTRPWTFYLNAGIQFADIPRRSPDRDFPTIHTWIRVSYTLAHDALPSYEIDEDQLDPLVERIRAIVHEVRSYFSARHQFIRERYLERPLSFLVYLDETLMKRSNQAVDDKSGEPDARPNAVSAARNSGSAPQA